MMEKKRSAGVIILGLIIIGSLWFGKARCEEKLSLGDSFVFPQANLISVENKDNVTVVRYETYNGGIRNFYEKKLRKSGWIKISDLGREDMTYCAGDWGGIYKKEQMRFKLHICGPDKNDFLTRIFFFFYNIPPEQILGKDFNRPKVKAPLSPLQPNT